MKSAEGAWSSGVGTNIFAGRTSIHQDAYSNNLVRKHIRKTSRQLAIESGETQPSILLLAPAPGRGCFRLMPLFQVSSFQATYCEDKKTSCSTRFRNACKY